MLKVLSTKLKVEEIKRFAEMAEQQSESKSGLLRHLVLEYLNNYREADRVASTGTSSPANSSEKGLLTEKNNGDDGLPLSQSPSSKDSLFVDHGDTKRRPEVSPKSSVSKGWLLLLLLLVLWLNSKRTVTVNGKSAFTTQPPQVDEHGLYTFRVGNTIVYSSSPIPFFW